MVGRLARMVGRLANKDNPCDPGRKEREVPSLGDVSLDFSN